MKAVIEFLELNGFIRDGIGGYTNGNCIVEPHTDHYQVHTIKDEQVWKWYSKDLTIYSLIGYLTYYGLMDKNYKQK